MRRRERSLGVAYLLWTVSLHRAYLGRWGTQLLYWLVAIGTFGVVFIVWGLLDAIRLPSMVREWNARAARERG